MIDNDSLTRPITCQCMAAYTVVGYIKVSGAELAAYNDLHFTITNPCEATYLFQPLKRWVRCEGQFVPPCR